MDTLTEQVSAVRAGRVKATHLVEAALEAIERAEDRTNAFTIVLPDDALERAKALDRDGPTGPLHGVPVAVKDLYDIAGVTTSGCTAAYLDRYAQHDSAVVARLRAAGAIVVAKTNMHELAFGTTTQVSTYGPARNPWDTERIPGGSSGGSGAAVASRAVLMAMGSDTGGSIRIPAAMCGVTGLKPTHGAVSLRGALPMTASFDTGGPLAVSAEDCLLVHRALQGFDDAYLYSRTAAPVAPKPVTQLRIGMPRSWYRDATDDVVTAVQVAAKVLEAAGATLVEIEGFDPVRIRNDVGPVLVSEFANHFRDLWDDDRLSAPIRTLMDGGRETSGVDYAKGREAALGARMAFVRDLAEVDVLLTPTVSHTAPLAADVDNLLEAVRSTVYTLPVNAAGLPAVSFPVGRVDGLPVGAQLIGPAWSEELLCAVVSAFQAETHHHLEPPPGN